MIRNVLFVSTFALLSFASGNTHAKSEGCGCCEDAANSCTCACGCDCCSGESCCGGGCCDKCTCGK